MRVLIVAHGFPPSARGGAELYAQAHANALIGSGDQVMVLAREADPSRHEFNLRRESRDGMAIAWINNTFASIRSFRDTYTDDRIDAVAARIIDEFAPDVAHIHHLTCLSTTIVSELAARNVPVFCTLHDYWFLCQRGQLLDRNLQPCANPGTCTNCLGPEASASPAIYRSRAALAPILRLLPDRLLSAIRTGGLARNGGRVVRPGAEQDPATARRNHMRAVLRNITHFLAPSAHLRDRFVAAGVDPSRISVSEYGWALPAAPAAAKVRASAPLSIGFIGSLMVSKAPHVLLEAAAGLPADSCVVHIFGAHADYHGDKSYRGRLDPLLGRPGVRFHGPVDRGELRAALAQIDVLVVPSMWPENSPLVIREAFLAGVPVIASRIGGIPETVSDNVNGLLVRPGDSADLARALRRVIDEPDLLPRLRAGIPAVRTIEDDVMAMRAKYKALTPGLKIQPPAPRPPAATGHRRLAAVVLNYNTPDQTFLATRSLLLSRKPVDHVVVVDNGGDEQCRVALTPLLDRITLLAMPRNLGFSGGMNAGIGRALADGADAVVLVNSDVVMPADCLEALESALFTTHGAGIAGPVVVSRASPDLIASSGISYNKATGRMLHRNVGAAVATPPAGEGVPPRRPLSVEAVSGCLMLVRREVFEQAGVFDPDFFFSFEDVDLCLRARAAGFSTIVVPAATALHEGGRSIGSGTARRFYFGARNQLRLARRHGENGAGRNFLGKLRPAPFFRSAYVVALNVAHAFRATGATLPARLAAVARGTRDYSAGRFGPDPGA